MKDGLFYRGEFREGKKHGKGILVWPNGNQYDGMFEDDLQHGIGVFKEKRSIKKGLWERGIRKYWID